jgi:CubicO group peptidase (beta-lactamase class C family)
MFKKSVKILGLVGVGWIALSSLVTIFMDPKLIAVPATSNSSEQLHNFEKLLKSYSEQGWFDGVAVGVDAKGKPWFFSSSIERKPTQARTFTENSVFLMGSLTKGFTAAAVLRLEEQGKLKISQTACTYLKSFCTPYLEKITLEHLLRHQSGLKRDATTAWERGIDLLKWDFGFAPYPEKKNHAEWKLAPERLGKPEFEPGTKKSYSNLGFIALSRVIELQTGKSLGQLFQDEFFRPLQMKNTALVSLEHPTLPEKFIKEIQWTYETEPDPGLPGLSGAGALYITAHDFLLWSRALRNHRVLEKKVEEKLFDFDSNHGGMGWMSGKSLLPEAETYAWHNGTTLGASSYWMRDLKSPKEFILLSATFTHEKTDELGILAFRALQGLPFQVPLSAQSPKK